MRSLLLISIIALLITGASTYMVEAHRRVGLINDSFQAAFQDNQQKKNPKERSRKGSTADSPSDPPPAEAKASPSAQTEGPHPNKREGNASAPPLVSAEMSPEARRYFDTALSHYQAKRFREAVGAYKQALSHAPNEAQIRYNLGMSYYSLNLYRESADSFKEAARLRPQWAEAYFRLGWLYYVLGKRELALKQYRTLKNLDADLAQKLNRILEAESSDATGSVKTVNAAASPNAGASIGKTTRLTLTPGDSKGAQSLNTAEQRSLPSPALENATGSQSTSVSSAGAVTTKPVNEMPAATASTPINDDESALTRIYRVGVGDVLDIRLLNASTNSSTLYTVLAGGLIEYPLIGAPLEVAHLTTDEIDSLLTPRIKLYDNPQVVVSVRQYVSHSVTITGLVNNPGSKIISREAVPLYVILAEAQPRTEAGRAVIMRPNGQSPAIDLADPVALNTSVRPGDVIVLSARPLQYYFIGGGVVSPGQKLFQPGITLIQAILAAGGALRPKESSIEVSREGDGGRLTTTMYILRDIKSGKVPDLRLQPGDRIEVVR